MGEIIRKTFSTPTTKLKLSAEQDHGVPKARYNQHGLTLADQVKEYRCSRRYSPEAGPTVGGNEQCSVCTQQRVKASRRTVATSEHDVYLDDSLKLEPAQLPTRSLTAELEEATEEQHGHT